MKEAKFSVEMLAELEKDLEIYDVLTKFFAFAKEAGLRITQIDFEILEEEEEVYER